MRPELETIEQIEKYLNNQLSDTEKQAFETKIKHDANLAAKVENQRNVLKGIKRLGAKKSISKAGKKYKFYRMMRYIGIALLIIGVSGYVAYSFYTNNQSSSIIEEKTTLNNYTNFEEVADSSSVQNSNLSDENVNSEKIELPVKKSQFFFIDSSKDTVIIGNEGTKITFKANTFDIPNKEKIKIELKEFYKRSDHALSNLTTITNDRRLLETGGMVFLEATVKNKKVHLKKESNYTIEFPYENKKEGMLLFEGVENANTIVWEKLNTSQVEPIVVEEINSNSLNNQPSDNDVATIVEEMPEFKGGMNQLFTYLKENVEYPKAALRMGISGTVYVNFTVAKDGSLENVNVIKEVDPLLDREAVRVVKSMPNWIPGKQKGKAVKVSYNLPVSFKLADGDKISKYPPEKIKQYKDSVQAIRKTEVENLLEEDTTDYSKPNSINKISTYVFANSTFGWINCDRFVSASTINQRLKTNDLNFYNVKLILHDYKSQLITFNKNGFISIKVPANQKITVFAIKYENDLPFICLQEIITSTQIQELQFEQLTKEKLQQCLTKIDGI
ncbi:MAG: energy transducer TonB [Vicingaceae bacterium]|nr:energy transducer TonB [Vicingaceae bacterium]